MSCIIAYSKEVHNNSQINLKQKTKALKAYIGFEISPKYTIDMHYTVTMGKNRMSHIVHGNEAAPAV